MKDPKTTTYGILTIVVTLINAAMQYMKSGSVDLPVLLTGLTAGYGLIKAADAK